MRLGTLFGSVIFVDGMGLSVMEIVFPLLANTTPTCFLVNGFHVKCTYPAVSAYSV